MSTESTTDAASGARQDRTEAAATGERAAEDGERGGAGGSGAGTSRLDPRAERIREAFERNARAVSLRPSVGRGTAVTTVRLRGGLTCQVEDDRWSLVADMSESWGGDAEGPDPGVLARAGLGTCLAAGYAMWAARRGVPIHDLTVEVEADYDARAELGAAEEEDASPAYSEVRVFVTVESEAPEAEIAEVLSEADEHSPWLRMFREPVRVRREAWYARPRDARSEPR